MIAASAELSEKQFPGHAASTQGNIRSRYLRNICKFAGLARIGQYPKMMPPSLSIVCTHPFRRIDDVAPIARDAVRTRAKKHAKIDLSPEPNSML